MHELPDVPALRAHEPPPGGLAALRERLDVPRRWWMFAIPVLAIAVAIAVIVLRHPAPVQTVAKTAVPDRQISTTFYWVASSPAAARADAPALPTVGPAVSIADAPRVKFGPP